MVHRTGRETARSATSSPETRLVASEYALGSAVKVQAGSLNGHIGSAYSLTVTVRRRPGKPGRLCGRASAIIVSCGAPQYPLK